MPAHDLAVEMREDDFTLVRKVIIIVVIVITGRLGHLGPILRDPGS